MGILKEPATFVKKLGLPKGFSVCELGDQWVTYTSPHRLAEEMYRGWGCGLYVSIDGNGRGTHTADLNLPLTLGLGQFDLVTDFGTGEHIFDQAQVWRTVHDLTKPGGYIAFDRPTQGYQTHSYFLADECVFRDVAAANGYTVVRFALGNTKRGQLYRGVFQKPSVEMPFVIPQQGRYHKILRPIMPEVLA
jgi:SAM-dependent methyltransferase